MVNKPREALGSGKEGVRLGGQRLQEALHRAVQGVLCRGRDAVSEEEMGRLSELTSQKPLGSEGLSVSPSTCTLEELTN